jgi:hypothetical protein
VTGSGRLPARLVVLVALVLTLPTLRQALVGDVSMATAALRFGLALVLGAGAVQLVRTAAPAAQPVAEEAPEESDEPESPGRRAEDRGEQAAAPEEARQAA